MSPEVLELPLFGQPSAPSVRTRRPPLSEELAAFHEFGEATRTIETSFKTNDGESREVLTFVNEYWTAKQRQASSLHEISYRACFKPQLPRFFIERLTQPGDIVYDPFMGRGTTPLEAALLGRVPWGNDINPLSFAFARPRLRPPTVDEIATRLSAIDMSDHAELPEDLLVFYHPDTLREICALKKYFLARRAAERGVNAASTSEISTVAEKASRATRPWRSGLKPALLDPVDDWFCMVALNRLTGHSPGFFSVYTLPPNQAVSVVSQRRINEKRKQTPPRRDVAKLILKKSRQLLRDCTPEVRATLAGVADHARFLNSPANATRELPDDSVLLVVTSPPFLDVVQYADDNWLRCWFLGIDPKSVQLTVPKRLDAWREAVTGVFRELHRVLKPGGHVAFEVGEVHGGKTKLEEHVLPCGVAVGLVPVLVVINDQEFTKTANCWGVDNMAKGTNTNRIVLFRKP
ncbi:MAG: site-specific DNA-methyltransferase [Verrucomicrobia bacterium]|nr:site-specific DNA-methyltransferase [Verrucomicrobiota bacterium]